MRETWPGFILHVVYSAYTYRLCILQVWAAESPHVPVVPAPGGISTPTAGWLANNKTRCRRCHLFSSPIITSEHYLLTAHRLGRLGCRARGDSPFSPPQRRWGSHHLKLDCARFPGCLQAACPSGRPTDLSGKTSRGRQGVQAPGRARLSVDDAGCRHRLGAASGPPPRRQRGKTSPEVEGHSLQSDPRDGLLTRRFGVESVVWDVGLSLGCVRVQQNGPSTSSDGWLSDGL